MRGLTDLFTLSFSIEAAAQKALGNMRRSWVIWLKGKDWRVGFLLGRNAGRSCHSFVEPCPHLVYTCRCVLYLSLQQHSSYYLLVLVICWDPDPSYLRAHPSHFQCFSIQIACLGSCYRISQNLSKVHDPQTSSIWPHCALYLLIIISKASTGWGWLSFAA